MLPNNQLSSQASPSNYLSPDDLQVQPLVSHERGGIALSDSSEGLTYQDWIASYEGGQIVLTPQRVGQPVALLTVPGVTELSLAFDQNMRPVVAYVAGGNAFLHWYDTQIAKMVTTAFPDIISPRVAMDDKRASQLSVNDVIFAYIRDAGLRYRQQRDRYQVEYTLQDNLGPGAALINLGMSAGLRLRFDVAFTSYSVPVSGEGNDG